MDYEDYYNNYNDLDSLMIEIKETALKGVKQDIIDKVERLEKENNELIEIKNNWNKLKKDYEQKERQLLSEVEEAKKEAKKLPIKELFENIQEEYYVVNSEYSYIDKCNKCDDNRILTLTDVYGRKIEVDCICKKYEYKDYKVKTKYLIGISEISKSNNKLRKFVLLTYKKGSSNNDYDGYFSSGTYLNENIVKTFEEALQKEKDNMTIYFTDEKEAQKYADYLNKKEKQKI